MSTRYRDFLASIAPPWLAAPQGQAWFRAVGDGYDELLKRAKDAVKQRLALHATDDGLAQLGVDRAIERGPGEATATYGARLQAAWRTWQLAGTPLGMLLALKAAGFPNVTIAQVNKRMFTLDANDQLVTTVLTDLFLVDADATFWSKFAVILQPPFPSDIDTSSMPPSDSNGINRIRRNIELWKPAHGTCAYFTLLVSGRLLGFPVRQLGPTNGVLGAAVAYRYTP